MHRERSYKVTTTNEARGGLLSAGELQLVLNETFQREFTVESLSSENIRFCPYCGEELEYFDDPYEENECPEHGELDVRVSGHS